MTSTTPASFAVLSALVLIGEAFPVGIPHLSDRNQEPSQFQTIGSLWALVLVVEWGPAPAATVVAIATLIADMVRRTTWWRMGLNVATSTICTAAAWLAYDFVGQGALIASPRWMLAVFAAGLGHSIVNHVLFKIGFGLYTGRARCGRWARTSASPSATRSSGCCWRWRWSWSPG